jgi:hypothetical protein
MDLFFQACAKPRVVRQAFTKKRQQHKQALN